VNPLKYLNRNVDKLKFIAFAVSLFPGLRLTYLYAMDQLGINGLETLLHVSGFASLILFIVTLAITPARRICSFLAISINYEYGKRLADWNWMVKLRRSLGVFSFLYAVGHFLVFFYFELDFEFGSLRDEVEERPFILAGLGALILLVPLFLTSTDYSMRLLRRNWRRLHRLMYPIALLIAAHYLWLSKPGVYDAYPYAAIIGSLLLFRLLAFAKLLFTREDDGMTVER